jgi:two-component system, OmpR family, phosphate regulon sensor histidine kinase PhoR
MRSRWWRRLPSAPPRIVAIYAILAFAWIAFSDRALEVLLPDVHARDIAQTLKGGFFVAVTSALLYVLIRRGERGHRQLGAELRATIDSMGDAVLLVDHRRCIVEANRAAVQLFGVESKVELLGPLQEWGRRFQLRSLAGEAVALERYASIRALAGEANARYDAIVRRADGRDVFVSVSASPVERPRGHPLAVTVLRDVSRARRLDEMREEFLSTAAHEFKTPLAVVKAYAQLMARREPAEAQALAVIQRQVDRLNRLVQHLLDTSRLRLEGDTGHRERFDLTALAGEVLERARPAAPSHALRLDARGPAAVVADKERIARVLTSLVDNAVRFSPSGGIVEARVAADGAEAVVSVRDHGLGIPPERQAHVFDRYYRAHAGTPDDYGGLGLGLEMSREIVRRHGGRMWFESAPGAGSTFHFSLPLAGRPP